MSRVCPEPYLMAPPDQGYVPRDLAPDQGELDKLIAREREAITAWAEKLKSLTKLEHSVYHWFVTSGVPKNRTCRELHLKTWEFEAIARSAGEKLGVPLTQIRNERREAAAA